MILTTHFESSPRFLALRIQARWLRVVSLHCYGVVMPCWAAHYLWKCWQKNWVVCQVRKQLREPGLVMPYTTHIYHTYPGTLSCFLFPVMTFPIVKITANLARLAQPLLPGYWTLVMPEPLKTYWSFNVAASALIKQASKFFSGRLAQPMQAPGWYAILVSNCYQTSADF